MLTRMREVVRHSLCFAKSGCLEVSRLDGPHGDSLAHLRSDTLTCSATRTSKRDPQVRLNVISRVDACRFSRPDGNYPHSLLSPVSSLSNVDARASEHSSSESLRSSASLTRRNEIFKAIGFTRARGERDPRRRDNCFSRRIIFFL